jgi:hypothetical protein
MTSPLQQPASRQLSSGEACGGELPAAAAGHSAPVGEGMGGWASPPSPAAFLHRQQRKGDSGTPCSRGGAKLPPLRAVKAAPLPARSSTGAIAPALCAPGFAPHRETARVGSASPRRVKGRPLHRARVHRPLLRAASKAARFTAPASPRPRTAPAPPSRETSGVPQSIHIDCSEEVPRSRLRLRSRSRSRIRASFTAT